jgi:hypothetical protein
MGKGKKRGLAQATSRRFSVKTEGVFEGCVFWAGFRAFSGGPRVQA